MSGVESINDRLMTNLIYNQYNNNNNTSVEYPDTQAAAHMTVFLLHIWFSCFNFSQLQAAVTHRCLAAAQAKKAGILKSTVHFSQELQRASVRESRLIFRARHRAAELLCSTCHFIIITQRRA